MKESIQIYGNPDIVLKVQSENTTDDYAFVWVSDFDADSILDADLGHYTTSSFKDSNGLSVITRFAPGHNPREEYVDIWKINEEQNKEVVSQVTRWYTYYEKKVRSLRGFRDWATPQQRGEETEPETEPETEACISGNGKGATESPELDDLFRLLDIQTAEMIRENAIVSICVNK
jgi:hypothetical protein